MKSLTLSAYWRSRNGGPGCHEETFPVRFTVRRYEQSPWVPENLSALERYDHEITARQTSSRIRRVIAFMDHTELLPSRRLFQLFPLGRGLPGYADHTLLWRDAEQRWLMTTEPYGMPEHLTAPEGWQVRAMPPTFGLWKAPLPDGTAETACLWLTPVHGGVDLAALAGRLM